MKYAMLSVVAVAGLLLADSAANAQVVIGGGFRGVGVGVGIGVAPPPVYYPAPVVVAPAPVYPAPGVVVAQPVPVVVAPPAVSVGVGLPLFVGGYRPFYGPGFYRGYYRR
jgi:hypothetical protein